LGFRPRGSWAADCGQRSSWIRVERPGCSAEKPADFWTAGRAVPEPGNPGWLQRVPESWGGDGSGFESLPRVLGEGCGWNVQAAQPKNPWTSGLSSRRGSGAGKSGRTAKGSGVRGGGDTSEFLRGGFVRGGLRSAASWATFKSRQKTNSFCGPCKKGRSDTLEVRQGGHETIERRADGR